MDLREVLGKTKSRLVALPVLQSPSLGSSNPHHHHGYVITQIHACMYCRRSQLAYDLQRPCTRCIKRNIGHPCHDEPCDDSNNKRTIQTARTAQNNDMSLVNSNLKSCHYTISRDHTEGAEDQKSKILADFGRKHIKAWTNLSLANINSPTADPDSSAEGLESLGGPDTQTFQAGSSNYVITYLPNSKDEVRISFRTYAAASTQSESFPPFTPLRATSIFGSSQLPSRTTKRAEMYENEQKAWAIHWKVS